MSVIRVGDRVSDCWWPWRVGVVVQRLKTVARVRWSDGTVWRYDRSHLRFLRLLTKGIGR